MGKNSAIAILVLGLLIFPLVYFFHQEDGPPKPAPVNQATSYEPVVVLELFTSQGCSSCPPADQLLHQLVNSASGSLYAVSYHVDYWNYIGWKDPFSKAEYTAMQRAYNVKLKSRSNYTPELVINGKEHMVGSDATKIKGRIKAYGERPASNAIEIGAVTWDGDTVIAGYDVKGAVAGTTLKAVLLLNERSTKVRRGENSGRTLLNSQIALTVKQLVLKQARGKVAFSIPELVGPGDTLSLLFMTENGDRDITGAGRASVPDKI